MKTTYFLAATIALFCGFPTSRGKLSSGLYYDNGLDQSVFGGSLSESDERIMQEEILNLLGLKHRPGPVFRQIGGKEGVVPKFMMDIYRTLLEDSNALEAKQLISDVSDNNSTTEAPLRRLTHSSFNIDEEDVRAIAESDVIVSFVNYGRSPMAGDGLEATRRYWFDVGQVPASRIVLGAELRVHKGEVPGSAGPFRVEVYQLVEGSTDKENLLDAVEVTASTKGWLIFDVSKALSSWVRDPKLNLGLFLKIDSGKGKRVIYPDNIGLSGSKAVTYEFEPFMVSYLKASPEEEIEATHERARRAAGNERKRGRNKSKRRHGERQYSYLDDLEYEWNPYQDYYGGKNRRRGCQKRSLYVSFRDLGWQDWIIAPEGYAAFYCHGQCSFPLNTHMNATNHAIVQTLVHLMNPYAVPKPCCAPTRLSGISVLYFDESSNVILKKYRNMVVKSCGCH